MKFRGPKALNDNLMQSLAMALRPGGMVIVIEAVRPSCLQQTGQLEGLLDLYFGAASGVGLWTIEEIPDWCRTAGLIVQPPKGLRRMPICKREFRERRPSSAKDSAG